MQGSRVPGDLPAGMVCGITFDECCKANGYKVTHSHGTICSSCLSRLSHQRRKYAAAAAAAVEEQEPSCTEPPIPPVTQTGPRKAYRVSASPVLSRPPILTRELTPFEKAFYLYQKRLNERLALPFTRYFYYKKGTPAGEEWKRKRASRKAAARDIGVYSGYGDEAWNDEVLVGDTTAEPNSQVEALIRDAEGKDIVDAKLGGDQETNGEQISGDEQLGEGARKQLSQQQQLAVERPMPRFSEADEKNDLRSLSRKMDRALYLMVKRQDGSWRFPQDRVYGRENLHQVCIRGNSLLGFYANQITGC
jgi:large subunit ribosomal protein L46